MKRFLLGGLAAFATITAVAAIAPIAQGAFTTADVTDAGFLRSGRDHYFEVTVDGEPLQRIRVQCVTFHEFDNLEVYVNGELVEPNIHYGFEEFTLTFEDALTDGQTIRILMENSRVLGSVNAGIDVSFRVFGTYPTLNNTEFPLGTAVVRTPSRGDNN